ncbi:hypothetical protein MMC15_005353 [Xylographa vitiligo]|nr:hypothetical protein [Xylographa vitiligo]
MERKTIVMAKLSAENTSWVGDELPDWENVIYTVDDPTASLHLAVNKGREANAYLTYIIQHYDNLPSTVVFLHSHKDGWPEAWHTDVKDYNNVISVQKLRLDSVQNNGYINLRCVPVPGCPDEIQPFRDPPEGHRASEHATEAAWKYMFGNVDVPKVIGVACCSQFAVSRKQVLSRPRADYERYLKWLMETPLDDAVSGRVLEYFWHMIFGQGPV